MTKKLRGVPTWVIVGSYISIILMNLLANKSIDFGIDWIALDCGIFISWLAFMCMDLITIYAGAKTSILVSLSAMCCNVFVAALFALISIVPGTWGEAYELGEVANLALDGTFYSNWFILFGSCIAFIASAVVNSLLNAAIGKVCSKDGLAEFAFRSYISTSIGQFVDNFIFASIISHALFGWSFVQCVTCSVIGASVEVIFEVVFSPLGYKLSEKWRMEYAT